VKNYISSEDFLKSLSQVKETDYKEINNGLKKISNDMKQLAEMHNSKEERAATV
jgi:hypothetical protein